jgi:hypothetical protein
MADMDEEEARIYDPPEYAPRPPLLPEDPEVTSGDKSQKPMEIKPPENKSLLSRRSEDSVDEAFSVGDDDFGTWAEEDSSAPRSQLDNPPRPK